jgi:hypothetical protein
LLRGTAGTAKAGHLPGAKVSDMTDDNLVPTEYQDHYVTWTQEADGNTQLFVSNITVTTQTEDAVQVFVGGILSTDYVIQSIAPVTVFFDPAPPSGQDVIVQIKQALSWYQPGNGNASNGNALQETNTLAARFMRGLI